MIYLHHYPASLFSEKIRLLLGYYNLSWQSVEISSIMPRPLLMPLSGGYRKTPVLQIGANVFSDTKIICKALARHVGDDALYAYGFAAHRAADWADSQLFRVTVALNFRPEAMAAMMGQFSEEEAAAFAKDRAELSGDQPIASLSPAAAMAYLEHALAELDEDVTKTGGYLFGEMPSIADFSVFHNLWFLKNNPVNADLLNAYDGVQAWFARMQTMGHGNVVVSDGQAALEHAKASTPVDYTLQPPPANTLQVGSTVSVTPIDYGCIPVMGKLVGVSHDEVVVARETAETGLVYNHFPQAGFEITAT
jgi:glutathione S-transferase